MRTHSYIPNLLSSVRIVLAPAILAAAYSNSRVGFWVLFGIAWATDALDGFLARRWRAETPMGRRLDRWGDGLTMGMAAIGIGLLWPDIVNRELRWVVVALAGYFMIGLHRFLQAATTRSPPGWTTKVLAMAVPVSLVPLLGEWGALPFQVAAATQAAVGFQKLVATQRRSDTKKAA